MKVVYISPYAIHIEAPDIDLMQLEEIKSSVTEDGRLFLRKTNVDGLYTYGLEQLKDDYQHRKGYIWSSRTSCINMEFDTVLVSVVFNNYTCAMEASVALPLVESFCSSRCIIKMTENAENDRSFKIVSEDEVL